MDEPGTAVGPAPIAMPVGVAGRIASACSMPVDAASEACSRYCSFPAMASSAVAVPALATTSIVKIANSTSTITSATPRSMELSSINPSIAHGDGARHHDAAERALGSRWRVHHVGIAISAVIDESAFGLIRSDAQPDAHGRHLVSLESWK